jgi:hypothetical protein
MNGVVQYLKVEHLICFQMVLLWQVLFLDFDHFVIKMFSAYKDLSILKFESEDFLFSLLESLNCYTKNHDYFYV